MSLKMVRRMKVKTTAGSKKKSETEKFADAIDVQIRIANGEKVKQGRGTAKSWMEDGSDFGVDKVLNAKIGKTPLHSKSAYVVDMKQKMPPLKELKELKTAVVAGKLTNRVNAILREQKKKAAAKQGKKAAAKQRKKAAAKK